MSNIFSQKELQPLDRNHEQTHTISEGKGATMKGDARQRDLARKQRYRTERHDDVLRRHREYNELNRERRLAAGKAWRASHPGYMKEWQATHPESADKKRERARARYAANRTEILAKAAKYREEHREEVRARTREWNKLNAGRVREYQRKYSFTEAGRRRLRKNQHESKCRKYGLSPEKYAEMALAQGGVCAICGAGTTEKRPKLSIDHDHDTGVVRGLLCNNCNIGIGHFFDDKERLVKAIAYLESRQVAPKRRQM
jgi:hypothetical protein